MECPHLDSQVNVCVCVCDMSIQNVVKQNSAVCNFCAIKWNYSLFVWAILSKILYFTVNSWSYPVWHLNYKPRDRQNLFTHYTFDGRGGLGQELRLTWKRCDLSLDTLSCCAFLGHV